MAIEWPELTIEQLKAPHKGSIAMGPFGSRIKAENFVTFGVPVIKGAQLHGAYVSDAKFDYLTGEKAQELSSSIAVRRDLVITHRGTIGQVSIIPDDSKYDKYIVSQSQLKVTLDPNKINPYFANYFFRSHIGQHRLLANASQVGVPAIAKASSSVKEILVPCPDLETQQRVVDILKSLDDKIELNRQVNETLEAMAQALFKSWFVDFDPVIDNALAAGNEIPEPLQQRATARQALGDQRKPLPADIQLLFPDRFVFTDEMGWVPEGWDVGPMTKLADLNPDSWTNRKHPDVIEYVDLANVKNGRISEITSYDFQDAPSRARRVLVKDDTIIGTVRPGNRSFAFIQMNGLTGSTGFAVMRPKQDSYRSFIYLTLTRNEVIEHFAHLADGAAYPAIRSEVVGNLTIAIPGDALFRTFDEYVYTWLSTIGLREESNQSIADIRDTLLPKLLSGELRILDAEKQVAEAV